MPRKVHAQAIDWKGGTIAHCNHPIRAATQGFQAGGFVAAIASCRPTHQIGIGCTPDAILETKGRLKVLEPALHGAPAPISSNPVTL